MMNLQQLMNNPNQLQREFSNFMRSVNGNPEQIVKQMVQSGKVTQEQLNYAQSIAGRMQGLLQ